MPIKPPISEAAAAEGTPAVSLVTAAVSVEATSPLVPSPVGIAPEASVEVAVTTSPAPFVSVQDVSTTFVPSYVALSVIVSFASARVKSQKFHGLGSVRA
jgi:hypothetical protein